MGGSNTALGYAQQRKDFQATITKLEAIIAEQQKGMKILAAQVQEQAAQILKMSAPARSEQTGTASGREQSVELRKRISRKRVGVRATLQLSIVKREQSGLLMHITTENVLLCTRMKC